VRPHSERPPDDDRDAGGARAGAPPRAIGPFRIERVLGRGGAGVVYEAHDTRDDTVVALKTIGADASDLGEHVYRLKNEFRALADLQHPNLVRFGELSCEDGQWMFTMELVRGCDFLEYVRPTHESPPARAAPTGPDHPTLIEPLVAPSGVQERAPADVPRRAPPTLDELRLRSALAQLVAALSAVHAAGRVHRDVKPSNVLVTGDGRVVVLDFGLVTALVGRAGGAGGASDAMAGTPAYMAPEQTQDAPVGPAADWYAVGVMLFAALSGSLPFEGATHEILEAKLTRDAPSVLELAPDAPADLAALCMDLLRMFPEHRPELDEIRARLGLAHDSANLVAAEEVPFVGRDAELRALVAAFEDVARGRPRVIVLEGEPGIGKSALAQAFLGALGDRALVFGGRCYEQESMPFKGVDAIVDALSQHLLDRDDPEPILRGGVRYLATVFPVLNRVPLVAAATANARKIDNLSALREQAFGELERLLARLAGAARVVLFLDDLQWADRDSVALLGRILGSGAAPMLFLATLRSGAELHADALGFLAGAERLALGGLSESESRVLCEKLPGGPSSAEERAAMAREAGGHPLFLGELLRSSHRAPPDREERARLQDVLWTRIQARDPLERRFLDVLALAGAPTPYQAVADAAGIDLGECQTRLGTLRAAQLVRVTRRGDERLVEPYHDRVRESVLLHAPGGDARAADHLRLGRALLARTAQGTLAARIFGIVQHLNAGRAVVDARAERVRIAELNLVATCEAHLTTAYGRARDHARAGIDLLGDAGWTDAYATMRDLWVERVRAEFLAGDATTARASLEAARARVVSPADRTDLAIAWIELETSSGHFERAIAAGRERLGELRMAPPARVTTVTLLAQYLATRRGERGRSTADLIALPPLRDEARASAMRVLMAIAPAAFWVDPNLVGWISLKLADMSMRHGVCDASSFGFAGYGLVLAGAFGKYQEAAAFGRLALALNERFGDEALAARLLQINGEFLAGWLQPFAEARRLLSDSFARASQEGETAYEAFAACSLSHVSMLEATDLARAQATSEWARDVCVRRHDWNMAGSVEAHARYAATLRGKRAVHVGPGRDGAIDAEFRELAGEPGEAPGAYYAFWSCNAWLAYLFGEPARAQALVEAARPLAQANFGNPGTVDLCFLEALVGAAAHDAAPWLKRMGLRRAVARRVQKLRGWAQGCAANFEPHYLIARAELARIDGDAGAAGWFERAVASARANEAGLREGIALELASASAAKSGDPAAAHLRAEAADAYRRVGATAKADAALG
jgi:serine/threonine protein kinase